MTSTPEKRLRILVLWGPSALYLLDDAFLKNPRYDCELVTGDRTTTRSDHPSAWSRLRQLRRRIRRGEFDLVVTGPVQTSPRLPAQRRFFTRLLHAFRYFTYKRRRLDTYWAPWLVAGAASSRVPLAVVDFLDTSHLLPQDYPLLRACTLYFKINLPFWPRRSLLPLENLLGSRRVMSLATKLRPFSFGYPRRKVPAQARPIRDRDIDLCLTGTILAGRSPGDSAAYPEVNYVTIRREIYERCLKLKDRFKVYCVDGVVPIEEYLELLQRSRLFVCLESFGCETGRLLDAAASGAVPLVNWPYVQIYRQYQPNIHAIYFSLIGDDFERVVAESLASPEKLELIARNARAYTIQEKEISAMGDYVVEETLRRHARNLPSAPP